MKFFGKTDVGRRRELNEDSFTFSEADAFAVVADGMGGRDFGEVASSLFVSSINSYMKKYFPSSFRARNREDGSGVAAHLMTLFDAWVGMGSPATPLDDDCHVKVIRGGVRDPRVLVVNIREMYTLGYTGGNIQIRPDDIVVVPPTLLGYIARFVAGVSAPFESFFRVTNSVARIQYSLDAISGDSGGRYGRGYTF